MLRDGYRTLLARESVISKEALRRVGVAAPSVCGGEVFFSKGLKYQDSVARSTQPYNIALS